MLSKISAMMTTGILLISVFNLNAIGADDQRQAVIKDLKNRVEIKYGESLWRAASVNQLVRPGTLVRTGALSKVELSYPDGTLTRLGSRTSITVLDKSIRAVKIDSGKMWFKVAKKSVGYRIYSPTAVAAITGTEGFVGFGDEPEKQGSNNVRLASSDLTKSFKTAEMNGTDGFSAGLVEGSMDVYKESNPNGELVGSPTSVGAGQVITLTGNNFTLQNYDINTIIEQNSEISNPLNSVNNQNQNDTRVQDQKLDPTNPTTEQIPGIINKQQDINNSPTTGDLEIIIK